MSDAPQWTFSGDPVGEFDVPGHPIPKGRARRSEKGLVVVPKTGNARPASTLYEAEGLAKAFAKAGHGPVTIQSQYTGDVLGTIWMTSNGEVLTK